MKMKRGEMIGFNGCLGYDYHPEDKTLSINEDEAERIRLKRVNNRVIETKKSRMTDMLIDGIISKDEYENKLATIMRKIHNLEGKKQILEDSLDRKKDVEKRMSNFRQILDRDEILVENNTIEKMYSLPPNGAEKMDILECNHTC